MEKTNSEIQIEAWTAVGAMTPEAIFARFDENITNSSTFTTEELAALQRNFETISDREGRISEEAFSTFVLSKTKLSIALTGAVRILFNGLCYLSDTPFKTSPPPTHLTIEGLKRTLMWILPSRASPVITETCTYPTRSRTDHRRLIFQSLATSRCETTVPYDVRLAHAVDVRKLAAAELGPDVQLADVGINFDEDGDEMYHDVLDALASTQPYVPVWFAKPGPDCFRKLATEMHKGAPKLFDLTIPEQRLTGFLELMVAVNFSESVLEADEELLTVARDMAASFQRGSPGEEITWPMFDFAIAKLLPHVLDPLYDFIGRVFFDGLCPFDANTGYLPSAVEGALLTRPRIAQLEGFLFNSICLCDIRHRQIYPSATRATLSGLIGAISSISECGVLLVSGHNSVNDRYLFGVFISPKMLDGRRVQYARPAFEETVLLFQLSPVHDVFRGRVGALAWVETEDEIVFGNENRGASLAIEKRVRRARFTHNPSEAVGEVVYGATGHRGKFEVEFTINRIELSEEDDGGE